MKTKWKVIIAVILAVVISVGSISAYKYITSPKEESIPLETTLEDAAELTTQKMIISDVFKSTKGNIPLINKNKFLVQYKTTVTAGLDVKKAKIKETDDEIRITIPHCTINEDSIKIKSSDLKIYDTNFAIMSIDKEAVIEVVAEAEEKAKKKAERRALTDQETENVLETMKRHEHGLYLAVLYYLGLRRGEALGLQWGDFDFDEDLVHVQRDIDFCGSTARDGDLKTDAADRYVPIPGELRSMLTKMRGFPQQYVFHTETGQPWPQSSFKRIWLSLMEDAHCVEEREIKAGTKRKNDIVKRLKPTLTPHYFRHNFATLLFEAGVEPLIAMKILGHTDYQTTANIYTHLNSEMMKKSSVDMEEVFRRKQEAKGVLSKAKSAKEKRSRKPAVDTSLPWAGRF